ncbi:MAG: hypothetical protein OEV62_04625 [Actinomycetota bacterium]|nr:hypothetical protein [Actinomycetota bacterium]
MWSRVLERIGALVVLALAAPVLVVLGPGGAGAAHADEAPGPVVVVGVGGLTWDDITRDQTPTLAGLLDGAAVGHLSVRSVYRVTCPVDAWLTVGSGRRSAVQRVPGADESDNEASLNDFCPRIPPLRDGRVVGWQELVDYNRTLSFDATLGLLGQTAADADRCVLGVGPGGALAAATEDGSVARYVADPVALVPADLSECALSVVDLGTVDERDPASPARGRQVSRLDSELAGLVPVLPEDATVVLLAASNSRPVAELQAIAVTGPGFPAGLLTSTSTKQDGLVLLTDITPTLFDLLGFPPSPDFVGAPVTSAPRDGGWEGLRAGLVEQSRKVEVYTEVAAPFFTALVPLQLALYGWAAWAFRRRSADPKGRRRVLRVTGWVAVVCSAIPVSTFLANLTPWWRWENPHTWLVLLVLGWSVVIGGLARVLSRRADLMAEMGLVAGATAVVLGADMVTGGSLQTASLMGYSPTIAGRLYGFGNVAFALFATAMIYLAAWLADGLERRGRRGAAAGVVVALGVTALVIDGLPELGSDFGGVIAIAAAFGVLMLGVLELRLSPLRLVWLVAFGLLVVIGISVVDWLRPSEERSHLGRFVQQVADGELVSIISRKLGNNLDILFSSVLGLLVPFAVLFLALVLMRPSDRTTSVLRQAYQRAPLLQPALSAWLVAMVVGFAVNDSGIAIPAVGIMLTLPLLISLSVRVLAEPDGAPVRAPAPSGG